MRLQPSATTQCHLLGARPGEFGIARVIQVAAVRQAHPGQPSSQRATHAQVTQMREHPQRQDEVHPGPRGSARGAPAQLLLAMM